MLTSDTLRERPPATRNVISRVAGALPDAVTAGMFVFAWFSPLAVDGLVRNLALVMIVEFLLVHATGFYSAFILGGERGARRKLPILAGLTAFYSLFIVVWSLIFGEWWPLLIFGWLLVGKLQWLRAAPGERKDMLLPAMAVWAASVVFYLLAVMMGLLLPLPYFGITPDIVPLLEMSGSGEWLERPQTVIASGVIYFFLLAFSKFKGLRI